MGFDIDKAWNETAPAAAGTGWEPVPAGTKCKVVVTDQRFKVVGEKATETCKVTMEVVTPSDHAGKHVWHDFWLTQGNLPYLKRDLTTLGWKGEKISVLKIPQDNSLIGLGAEIVVGIEERDVPDRDTGEMRKMKFNNVKFFTAPWTPPPPKEELPPEATGDDDPEPPF